MATKKISEFTTLGSLSDSDILPVVNAGSNKKITGATLKTYAQSGLTIPTDVSDLTDTTSLLGSSGAPGQGVPTGGTTGQVLAKIDGDDYNTEWVDQTGSGSGDMVGPASATDNALVRFDGTTGKLSQTSLVTVSDTGAITAPSVGSVIPFYYANQAAFPSATTYHGAVAHSHADGKMYFAHGGAWSALANASDVPVDVSDLTDTTSLLGGSGAPGEGVPTGGTTGQVLAKIDGDDYNTEWVDQATTSVFNTGTTRSISGEYGVSDSSGTTVVAGGTGTGTNMFYWGSDGSIADCTALIDALASSLGITVVGLIGTNVSSPNMVGGATIVGIGYTDRGIGIYSPVCWISREITSSTSGLARFSGGLTFQDNTVQTTAYTGEPDHEAYEITNRSASGTTYSVSVGTDGMISFPVIDGERTLWGAVDEDFNIKTTRTDPGIDADISILSADDIWMEAGDDINLEAADTVRITSDNTGSGHQWQFGTDGNITLPAGGTISEGGGLTGAIRLTPAGGANEYQALVIYPTANPDGDHVHLTAGGGTTELYLGSDTHYVKLVDGGNVEVQASSVTTATWTFDTAGNIDAQQALGIKVPDGVPSSVTVINNTTEEWNQNPLSNLATIGGTGSGLTVNVTVSGVHAGDIAIATAGTGYTSGDVITVVSGTSTANFTIAVAGRNSWQFGTDGTLTLPGDLVINGFTNVFGSNVALLQSNNDAPLLSLSSGSNGGVSSLWVEDISNVGTSNIAAVYANPTSGSGIVRIAVGQNGSPGPNLWDFGTDGDLTAPGNIILNNPVTTVTESVTGTVADSTANPFTFRILKADNPQLVIPFADPNFLLRWTGSDAGSQAAATQAPGGQGVSSLVSDDGTYWNFDSWFGLNTSRPNTGTVFTVEYGVVVSDTMISTTETNLVIEADGKQYKFGTNGDLTLPAGGDIVDSDNNSVIKIEAPFAIKTTGFDAFAGGRYGVNTTSNTVTATLPASPAAGDAIWFADAGGAYATNNLIINPGSNTIMSASGTMTVSINDQSFGLFYNGTTWRVY